MLDENVMRAVDAAAHRAGMTRSAFVNETLAGAVGYVTPQQRINDIFSAAEALFARSADLVPFFAPDAGLFSLKSSLEYKYRPTVKYEVALSSDPGPELGTLNVIFRTQSQNLIAALTEFFRVWKGIEDGFFPGKITYALYDGRLERSLRLPEKNVTPGELAEAITDYVNLFDRCLKARIAGRITEDEIRRLYSIQAANAKAMI